MNSLSYIFKIPTRLHSLSIPASLAAGHSRRRYKRPLYPLLCDCVYNSLTGVVPAAHRTHAVSPTNARVPVAGPLRLGPSHSSPPVSRGQPHAYSPFRSPNSDRRAPCSPHVPAALNSMAQSCATPARGRHSPHAVPAFSMLRHLSLRSTFVRPSWNGNASRISAHMLVALR
jgi:hypothetical protein